MYKLLLLALFLIVQLPIEGYCGHYPPPPNIENISNSDDVYDKCISVTYPNVEIFGLNPDGTLAIPQSNSANTKSYDGCGNNDVTPADWYGCMGHLPGSNAVKLSLHDSKTKGFSQGLPNNFADPGRFCLKYFGVADPTINQKQPYGTGPILSKIWGDYCESMSQSYDEEGVVGACRRFRPGGLERLLLKRSTSSNPFSISYTINDYLCSFQSVATNPSSCQFFAINQSWVSPTHGIDNPPWMVMGGDVNFNYNDIANITNGNGGFASMPSSPGKNDSAGHAFCAVRIPPLAAYPGSNLFGYNYNNIQKVGINYNLNINETYEDPTFYAAGQRNEICAYLLNSQVSGFNTCSKPYLGFPDLMPPNSNPSQYNEAAYAAGSFIGCVQEPLYPPPPTFNAFLTGNPTPTISGNPSGTFISTNISVTNYNGTIPNGVAATNSTLSAPYGIYPAPGNNVYGSQCALIETGLPQNSKSSFPKYFTNPSNNNQEPICAVIPKEMRDRVCICYQSNCANLDYIQCTAPFSRPNLAGSNSNQYSLTYTWDDTYHHGINITFADINGNLNPPSQKYSNTIFEILYKQQEANLIAIRNQTQLPANTYFSGFLNDKINPDNLYGLDLVGLIPYNSSNDPTNFTISYKAIYTPQVASTIAPGLSGGQCMIYSSVDGNMANAAYQWMVVPAGNRSRANSGDFEASNNFGLDRIGPNICVGADPNCGSQDTKYVLPKTDQYCRSFGNYNSINANSTNGIYGDPYHCPIPMEMVSYSENNELDPCFFDPTKPCACHHESLNDPKNTSRATTALELAQPGVYLYAAPDEANNLMCLFTSDPVTYYIFTGNTQLPTDSQGFSKPQALGCVKLPPENCKPINVPSAINALNTWDLTLPDEAVNETKTCPSNISYTDTNNKTYQLQLEPQKNYLLSVSTCTGNCAVAFNQAQLLLQQSYRKNCKIFTASDSSGFTPFWGYGQVDITNLTNLVPDCQLSVDSTTVQQINSLLQNYSNIVNLQTLANTTFANNDPSKLGSFVFASTSNINNGNNVKALIEDFGTYNSNGLNTPLLKGDFYYFDFPDCNKTPIGDLNSCSQSQSIKAQKILYYLLATKDDTRNLSLAEENFVRLNLLSSIDSSSSSNTAVLLSNTLLDKTPLTLRVQPTTSITRTCNSGQNSFIDSNLNVPASCKINPEIEMCPPLLNSQYGSAITGYADWPGFNFWDNMPNNFAYPRYGFNSFMNYSANTTSLLGTDISNVKNYLYFSATNQTSWIQGSPLPGVTQSLLNAGWQSFYPTVQSDFSNNLKFLTASSLYSDSGFWNPLKLSFNLLNGPYFFNDGNSTFNNLYEPQLRLGYMDFYIRGTCANKSSSYQVKPVTVLDMSSGNGSASTINQPVRACRVYFMPVQPNSSSDAPLEVIGSHWMPVMNPCSP